MGQQPESSDSPHPSELLPVNFSANDFLTLYGQSSTSRGEGTLLAPCLSVTTRAVIKTRLTSFIEKFDSRLWQVVDGKHGLETGKWKLHLVDLFGLFGAEGCRSRNFVTALRRVSDKAKIDFCDFLPLLRSAQQERRRKSRASNEKQSRPNLPILLWKPEDVHKAQERLEVQPNSDLQVEFISIAIPSAAKKDIISIGAIELASLHRRLELLEKQRSSASGVQQTDEQRGSATEKRLDEEQPLPDGHHEKEQPIALQSDTQLEPLGPREDVEESDQSGRHPEECDELEIQFSEQSDAQRDRQTQTLLGEEDVDLSDDELAGGNTITRSPLARAGVSKRRQAEQTTTPRAMKKQRVGETVAAVKDAETADGADELGDILRGESGSSTPEAERGPATAEAPVKVLHPYRRVHDVILKFGGGDLEDLDPEDTEPSEERADPGWIVFDIPTGEVVSGEENVDNLPLSNHNDFWAHYPSLADERDTSKDGGEMSEGEEVMSEGKDDGTGVPADTAPPLLSTKPSGILKRPTGRDEFSAAGERKLRRSTRSDQPRQMNYQS